MKASSSFYRTLCEEETLYEAWKKVKDKKSAGGIDGITLSCFEDNMGKYIGELSQELKAGTWAPEPYYRIEIPKNASSG